MRLKAKMEPASRVTRRGEGSARSRSIGVGRMRGGMAICRHMCDICSGHFERQLLSSQVVGRLARCSGPSGWRRLGAGGTWSLAVEAVLTWLQTRSLRRSASWERRCWTGIQSIPLFYDDWSLASLPSAFRTFAEGEGPVRGVDERAALATGWMLTSSRTIVGALGRRRSQRQTE